MNWYLVSTIVSVMIFMLSVIVFIRGIVLADKKSEIRQAKWEERVEGMIRENMVKMEGQLNFILKQGSEQAKKLTAMFKRIDRLNRGQDVLWAIVEERTGKLPIAKEQLQTESEYE